MRSRTRNIKFEHLTKEGKAGVVAKHGSAAYQPVKIGEKAQFKWEKIEPIFNIVMCQLKGFKTASYQELSISFYEQNYR